MNKHKRSQNPLVYWWNEFLFARYFEYETDLSPQELAEALEALAHKRQGWVWGLEKIVDVTLHPNEKGLDFDVQSRRRRLFDPIGITTARTLGSATVDSATGNLQVHGNVKLGRFIQIFFFLYVTFILMSFVPLFLSEAVANYLVALFPIMIIGTVFSLLWLRIYTDRNNLAERIEEAVFAGKSKRMSDHRTEDGETENLYRVDENIQANRQQK